MKLQKIEFKPSQNFIVILQVEQWHVGLFNHRGEIIIMHHTIKKIRGNYES